MFPVYQFTVLESAMQGRGEYIVGADFYCEWIDPGTMPVQRSGFGTLTIKKPRVFGRRSPDTQLVGTIQEQERSGLGILTTTNPRMLGTQPKTNVRLFGMLQGIDKN